MKENRIFLAIVFLFVTYWIGVLFQPFLLNITIASLLAVAMSNINVKLHQITKNQLLSATLSTIVLFALFFAPIGYIIYELAKNSANLNPNSIENTVNFFRNYSLNLPESLKFLEPKIHEMISGIDFDSISKQVLANIANIGKLSAVFFKDIFMITIFFFFASLYGVEIVKYARSVMPMKDEDVDMILFEIANVMSVVFYSIILTAFFEGALFAILGLFFGYDGLLLGVLYGFASLVPIIGGALMWIPLSAYEYANGNVFRALTIIIYTIVVISVIADTFIKPLIIKYINEKLVKTPTKINELLIFFAIIAGLSSFGFWGMILGPAIITFFLSLLKLYRLLKEHSLM